MRIENGVPMKYDVCMNKCIAAAPYTPITFYGNTANYPPQSLYKFEYWVSYAWCNQDSKFHFCDNLPVPKPNAAWYDNSLKNYKIETISTLWTGGKPISNTVTNAVFGLNDNLYTAVKNTAISGCVCQKAKAFTTTFTLTTNVIFVTILSLLVTYSFIY